MHETVQNGVMIARTPTGIGVMTRDAPPLPPRLLCIEVDYGGVTIKRDLVSSYEPWRDYYHNVDMLECVVRVREGERTLAELGLPGGRLAPFPFMVLQGEQTHTTENYVSVPPALTITDDAGDVWTFGFNTAERSQSPRGEFAFNVYRNGRDAGEVASRIERHGGKVRVFTRHGWKVWNGRFFF